MNGKISDGSKHGLAWRARIIATVFAGVIVALIFGAIYLSVHVLVL